jgi:hypothetical protein
MRIATATKELLSPRQSLLDPVHDVCQTGADG